jgi:glycosyltransferase involved in cell wall biosynthesis
MSDAIRVLQLLPAFTVGGAELLAVSLAGSLNPERFETHICALFERGGNPLRSELDALTATVHNFRGRRLYSPTLWRNVINYVRKHRINIVHTHLLPADIIGRLIARFLGIPVVSTLHSIPEGFATARFDRYWLERGSALYLSNQLVTVANYVKKQYEKDWHTHSDQVEVIYNAVPIERYIVIPEPSVVINEKSNPVIMTVGRLIPDKAHNLLLDAAYVILQRYPNVQFWIVGHGDELEHLQAQAARLGITKQIQFLGMRRDIPALLAQCDIFVLPSRREGLPLSVVEAMAAARPVVVTDVGGNRELVTHDTDGLVIPSGDANLLAAALLSLLEHPEKRISIAQAGRKRVQRDFTMALMIQQYEAIYERLITVQSAPKLRSFVKHSR